MLKEKGFSLVELTAVMTISAMLAGGAAVVYDAHLKDSEESTHIANAKAIAFAVDNMVVQDNLGPNLNGNVTFTLAQVYSSDKLAPIFDPSAGSGVKYSDTATICIVENKADSTGRPFLKYYVTLKNLAGTYSYIKQADLTLTTRKDADDLIRSDVKIPKRNATGW